MKKFLIVLLFITAAVSVAGNVLLYRRYSSGRPLMRIGSETITVKEYRDQVDYQYGKAVLNKLAYAKLVLMEAKKSGVLPTDKEIDQRIADIERLTPKALESALNDPQKMSELRESMKTDIALENLTIKDIKTADAEVRAFYSRNRQLFAVPTQARTTLVIADSQIDASTATKLLQDPKMTPGVIANQPRLKVVGVNGFNINWDAIPTKVRDNISRAVLSARVGSVVTVPVGGQFVIARTEARENEGVIPFQKVKPRVERMVKLQKASPRQLVLAKLYEKAGVSFEVDKYAAYFQDVEEALKQIKETKPNVGKTTKTASLR